MQFIVSGQRIATENFVTGKLYTILFKNDTQVNLMCISIGADCVVFQGEAPLNLFTLTMQNADTIDTIEPTQLGTTNYNNLINKPSINGVDLIGNKTSAALGIRDVPAIIESDEGKILTASSDGTYTWQPAPSSGTMDYTQLNNKPQINSVTLTGNVSLADLGAAAAADIPTTPADIGAEPAITSENMLDADLVDDTSSTNKFATAAQLAQIATNENNISMIKHAANTEIYFSETEPTESGITSGSYWISTSGVHVFETEATKTGVPPITFTSNGDNLSDYTITGASGGVGEVTVNLLSPTSTTTNQQGNVRYGGDFAVGTYYVYNNLGEPIYYRIGASTPTSQTIQNNTGAVITADDRLYVWSAIGAPKPKNTNIMVADSDIAIPYEPYGYKIPVICGGVTTNIYIDNQLGAADSIDYTTSQIGIPTIDGSNTLTIGTTTQPSNVSITYTGWK